MTSSLPHAEELQKLTARAVVAYAARTAHRVSQEFRGAVADEVLDHALSLLDQVLTAEVVSDVDPANVIAASERVVDAFLAAPADARSAERTKLLFTVIHAAITAMYAIEAAAGPQSSQHQMKRAAEAAQRAVDPILGSSLSAAVVAAKRDYEVLLREYGQHDDVVIGDPIACFEDKK